MVNDDYLVRCKRCGFPYSPENMSRVRTCVFCRKATDVHSRKKKIRMILKNIKKYFNSAKHFPIKENVLKWASLKFDVSDETGLSYLKELIEKNKVEIYDDGFYERVRLLD